MMYRAHWRKEPGHLSTSRTLCTFFSARLVKKHEKHEKHRNILLIHTCSHKMWNLETLSEASRQKFSNMCVSLDVARIGVHVCTEWYEKCCERKCCSVCHEAKCLLTQKIFLGQSRSGAWNLAIHVTTRNPPQSRWIVKPRLKPRYIQIQLIPFSSYINLLHILEKNGTDDSLGATKQKHCNQSRTFFPCFITPTNCVFVWSPENICCSQASILWDETESIRSLR